MQNHRYGKLNMKLNLCVLTGPKIINILYAENYSELYFNYIIQQLTDKKYPVFFL